MMRTGTELLHINSDTGGALHGVEGDITLSGPGSQHHGVEQDLTLGGCEV